MLTHSDFKWGRLKLKPLNQMMYDTWCWLIIKEEKQNKYRKVRRLHKWPQQMFNPKIENLLRTTCIWSPFFIQCILSAASIGGLAFTTNCLIGWNCSHITCGWTFFICAKQNRRGNNNLLSWPLLFFYREQFVPFGLTIICFLLVWTVINTTCMGLNVTSSFNRGLVILWDQNATFQLNFKTSAESVVYPTFAVLRQE